MPVIWRIDRAESDHARNVAATCRRLLLLSTREGKCDPATYQNKCRDGAVVSCSDVTPVGYGMGVIARYAATSTPCGVDNVCIETPCGDAACVAPQIEVCSYQDDKTIDVEARLPEPSQMSWSQERIRYRWDGRHYAPLSVKRKLDYYENGARGEWFEWKVRCNDATCVELCAPTESECFADRPCASQVCEGSGW